MLVRGPAALEHGLQDVGGVGGDPARAIEVELGPAVLVARDVVGVHAHAEHLARGDVDRTAQADEHGVDVGALSRLRGEQRAHVALATALDALVAGHVLDDPIVDGARLVKIARLALDDLVRRVFDLVVDGHEPRALQVLGDVGGQLAVFLHELGARDELAVCLEAQGRLALLGLDILVPLEVERLVAGGVLGDFGRLGTGCIVGDVRHLLILVVLRNRDPHAHGLARPVAAHVDVGRDRADGIALLVRACRLRAARVGGRRAGVGILAAPGKREHGKGGKRNCRDERGKRLW